MGGNLISSSNLLSVNDNVVWRNEVLKGLYDRNSKEISNTKQYQSTHEAQVSFTSIVNFLYHAVSYRVLQIFLCHVYILALD